MRWYTGDPVYDTALAGAFALVPLTVLGLRFLHAPYGRFAGRARWALGPRLGWFSMELPATLVFWVAFLAGPRRGAPVPLLLAGLWTFHYLNRGLLFPLRMRVPAGQRGTFGLSVVASGWVVTSLHGYLHGAFFAGLGAHLTPAWLSDPRFVGGLAVYAAGFALNAHSDAILRALRRPEEVARGERVYRIPRGGGFRWVSNPSYLGELVLWGGFALATWSLAGVFIFAISAANLVPRALATHRWYRARFPDYPPERRALVPYLL